ncbi:FecR family protein [Magnetospirillum sulfuroxidans]|uniref:FecR domain-containing protein n=1 Tax=Magnetospirillum sulfuroxidans TaxID=611300 RepID=A0ABS5IDB8_9PROT|nr:FecR domain-containing protein [Magnetospirillum sulfuroxidans]MBR9971723.1 FecR domain-containing protein [Magnetospirillum sulfuroxidans]
MVCYKGGALIALMLAAPAWAAPVGTIKNTAGEASVLRGEQKLAAAPGLALEQSDSIVTGSDGSVGLTLRDNTTLSVGPRTTLGLDEFDFEPASDRMKLVASVARGTMMMTSGTIAKLAPEKVSVVTKTGTIGVRGTRFVVSVEE